MKIQTYHSGLKSIPQKEDEILNQDVFKIQIHLMDIVHIRLEMFHIKYDMPCHAINVINFEEHCCRESFLEVFTNAPLKALNNELS